MLKVFAIVCLVLVLGRGLYVTFVQENKADPERLTLGLSSDKNAKVREVQETLKDAGLYQGGIDGVLGEGTRNAIKAFQRKRQIKPSGKIDVQTNEALSRWRDAQPKILPGIQAPSRFVTDEPASQSAPVVWEKNKASRVKQVQTALKNAGYYQGKIDGKNGPATRKALKEFQKAQGLAPDGVAGNKTRERLGKFLAYQY